MRNQREFLTAVVQQTAKIGNITKLGSILDIASRNLITNVDFNALKDYLPYAVEFSTDNLLTESLPGEVPDLSKTNGVSIFVVDEEETEQMIKELFFPEELTSQDGNTISGNTTNATGISSTSNSGTSNSKIKIEVLNGTSDGKILQQVVEKLKDEGYNVSRTGTTTATSKTVIANKNQVSETTINDIQETIGTGTVSNSNAGTSNKADVTVIIGKDYKY